jgi:hypothetical protein
MFKPISLKTKFIRLSWDIIYHKALYYELAGNDEYDHLRISDHEFDRIEKEYRKLAKQFNEKPTAADAIGFSLSKPSHITALSKVLLDHYFYVKESPSTTGRNRC